MKGQAALEFLMTYGWAILIVIAVAIALWRMGVLSPSTGVVKCSPPCFTGTPFSYVDHNADDLVINTGLRVNITQVSSSTCGPIEMGIVGEANTQLKINATGCFGGNNNKVTIKYVNLESGLEHTVNVTLSGA